MIDDRDRKLVEIKTKLEDSRNKAHDFEVELEHVSVKYNDAVKDGQTKLKEAEKKLTTSEYDLSEEAEKVTALETNLKCIADDLDKATNNGHSSTNLRIIGGIPSVGRSASPI